MLIDGEKWACEACVRGHRVSTCKHHGTSSPLPSCLASSSVPVSPLIPSDRPLIRINRKGRPFSTCSICNCTPCNLPDEHNKLKREAELRAQAQNVRASPLYTHYTQKQRKKKQTYHNKPKTTPSHTNFKLEMSILIALLPLVGETESIW